MIVFNEKIAQFCKKYKIKGILSTIFIGGLIAAIMCFNVFLASLGVYTTNSFQVPVLDAVDDLGGERYDVSKGDKYLAHPDLVMADDGTIWCMYPEGHGRGPILAKKSTDFGKTWTDVIIKEELAEGDTTWTSTVVEEEVAEGVYKKYKYTGPASWAKSEETPTLYNLHFVSSNGEETGESTLMLVSGNPAWSLKKWGKNVYIEPNGFNYTTSTDNGESWAEFTTLYGKEWATATGGVDAFDCIVAMASLTQLKENGKFVNKWMGLFHDHNFVNYKTILTFETDSDGNLVKDVYGRYIANWSYPTPVFEAHREAEKLYGFCEVEVVREPSADVKTLSGDRLVAIARCNNKVSYSYMMVSSDEGETWQTPQQLPIELCGDRHKAEYDPITKRFVISFRQLCVFKVAEAFVDSPSWTSIGWVGWVGSFEQLVNCQSGDAVIVLGATTNTDNGYAGTVYKDGQFLMAGYGTFDKNYASYIMAVRFSIDGIEKK